MKERDRYLRIARRHTVRLGSLIGDLFELSKLDSASVIPQLETFSVPELVQDIAQEFQLEAENKDITLSISLDSSSAFTIGDIGLIQRVLENLVRNAIRFTPVGGEVTLSITERPQTVAVQTGRLTTSQIARTVSVVSKRAIIRLLCRSGESGKSHLNRFLLWNRSITTILESKT